MLAIFISQVCTSVLRLLVQYQFINAYIRVNVYIVALCVCNFIAENFLNARQKPNVFENDSEMAVGTVGVHTIDVGPSEVFHAMA